MVIKYRFKIYSIRLLRAYCFSTWTNKTFQMQHMWCNLYKNGTDPNLENCSFLKKGSHSNYKWCMYCGYILFQTQKCSYWGKCNPNLDNCSYCEGRKPYYILKNFLLLLYNYLFNLVLFQFSRIKKFITYYSWCHKKVSSHNHPVFSIHKKFKLEPLWKYGSYLVIFQRNCFYVFIVPVWK